MTGFEIIFDKVTILVLLTLIGFTSYKLNWLGQDVKAGLQKLIFNLSLPLLIFTTISGFTYSSELVGNGLIVFALTYLFSGMQYLLGWVSSRFFNLPNAKAVIHQLHTAFGNVVFLGYPLIDALFPDTPALFYAALYHLAQTSIIWTFGVSRLDGRKSDKLLGKLKKLINPNTIAFALGFLFMIFNVQLPNAVNTTFEGIGSSTLFLSMIYIGMLVANFAPRKKDFGWDVLVLNFNKLILSPFLVFFISSFLLRYFGISLSVPAMGALILQSAMPCMAIMVILARNYDADENAAMVNVFTTTLMGLITLPVIYWLLLIYYP